MVRLKKQETKIFPEPFLRTCTCSSHPEHPGDVGDMAVFNMAIDRGPQNTSPVKISALGTASTEFGDQSGLTISRILQFLTCCGVTTKSQKSMVEGALES